MIRIERHARPGRAASVLAASAAIGLSVLGAALLFVALGYPARATLDAFFVEPVASRDGWSELALKASPLAIMATGLAACFRAGVWNIGADGQFTIGALCAGACGLAWGSAPGPAALPAMVLAGIAGGMAWAAIPAWLRTRLGVSEVLVSLMLTYVAGLLLGAMVFGPLRDPDGFNFPQSRMLPEGEMLGAVWPGLRVTWGTLAGLAVPLAAAPLLARTVPGFAIASFGASPAAARFAGFSEAATVWTVLLVSGGLAGLAGGLEIAGPIGQLLPEVSSGSGFASIVVALLARLDPLLVLPAAILVALCGVGGDLAQVAVGLPKGAAGVVQALLLATLLCGDAVAGVRLRRVGPRLTAGRA